MELPTSPRMPILYIAIKLLMPIIILYIGGHEFNKMEKQFKILPILESISFFNPFPHGLG